VKNGRTAEERRLQRFEKAMEEDRKRWASLVRYLRSNEERWRAGEQHRRKTDERIEALFRLVYRKLEG
jgi:hypothetical protein